MYLSHSKRIAAAVTAAAVTVIAGAGMLATAATAEGGNASGPLSIHPTTAAQGAAVSFSGGCLPNTPGTVSSNAFAHGPGATQGVIPVQAANDTSFNGTATIATGLTGGNYPVILHCAGALNSTIVNLHVLPPAGTTEPRSGKVGPPTGPVDAPVKATPAFTG